MSMWKIHARLSNIWLIIWFYPEELEILVGFYKSVKSQQITNFVSIEIELN